MYTIKETVEALKSGKTTSVNLVKDSVETFEKDKASEKPLNAFLELYADAILKAEEMTLSQLSKSLKTSPTTLLRHVEVLLNSRIIYINRRDGLQIFYKVNSQAFLYMTPYIECFLKSMSNITEGEKENERQQ